jgi:GT2 family glycosyltransferase
MDALVLKGCNLSFRRNAIGTLKFESRLSGRGAQVGNDACFCLNIIQAGWRLRLTPKAIVDHYPAQKSDYSRDEFNFYRCFESTYNMVAIELSNQNWIVKLKYILFYLIVGNRNCPGVYFIVHSIFKRPKSLIGQLKGGWKGFIGGYKLSGVLEKTPPGFPKAQIKD